MMSLYNLRKLTILKFDIDQYIEVSIVIAVHGIMNTEKVRLLSLIGKLEVSIHIAIKSGCGGGN